MSQNDITAIRKSDLSSFSPFCVDYTSAKLVAKITKEGKRYNVISIVVYPVGITSSDAKHTVELFANEYKAIVALGFDVEGVQATEVLNQKTGQVSNIYQKWSAK